MALFKVFHDELLLSRPLSSLDSFFELAELFPLYSADEIVKVYAALDAIPGYLVKFDPDVSVENNIEE